MQVSKSQRLIAADGIRAFACLIVLIVHHIIVVFPQTYPYLTGCGKIGVWLFFVLSAYLLTHRFLTRGFSIKEILDYGIARFLRIYPAYFTAVILFRFVGTAGINNNEDVIAAMSLTKGFSHLWTIPVEFKFYVILPVVAWLLLLSHRRFGIGGVVIVGIVSICLHQIIFPYYKLQENSTSTFWYFSCFVLGICATFFHNKITSRTSLLLGVGVLTLILLLTPFMRYWIFGSVPSNDLMNKYLVFGVLWGLFIVTQTRIDGRNSLLNVLTSKALIYIGRWSYSIYLIHWYFINQTHKYFPQSSTALIASMLLTISFGALMYYLVETPFLTLRNIIYNKVLYRT